MSWHRTDDGARIHPKIGQLDDVEARALVFGVWLYCAANNQTRGDFTADELGLMVYATPKGPRSVTPQQLRRFVTLRLVDAHDDGTFHVHDWESYNPKDPTAADRMRRMRNERRNTDRNNPVTPDVTPTVTPPVTKPSPRARASRPVPYPPGSSTVVEGSTATEHDDDEQHLETLAEAGWSSGQIAGAEHELARAVAWVEHARSSPVRNVAAFSASGFAGGGWPVEAQNGAQPSSSTYADPSSRCGGCGRTFGEGHADDCPRMAAAVAAAAAEQERTAVEPVDREAGAAAAAELASHLEDA